MLRPICSSAIALALALFVCGCGAQEDKLVREQVATIDKLAQCYGSVVDKATYEATLPEIGKHKGRLAELDKQLTKLGPERKEAALKKFDGDLKQAQQRYKQARAKAAETAFNAKSSGR